MPRRCSRTYVLPGRHPGLLVRGNIDICDRPRVWDHEEQAFASVRSVSFRINKREVLMPTVIGETIVSDGRALEHYRRTGRHLGIFRTARDATVYAGKLHRQQERLFG